MSRSKSKNDEDEQEASAAELVRLQREYRLAEGSRKAFFDESRHIIAKQKKSTDKVMQDIEELQREIDFAEDHVEGHVDAHERQHQLHLQVESMNAELELDKKKLAELDDKLHSINRQIDLKEKSLRLAVPDRSRIKQVHDLLERRLEKALNRMNTFIVSNAKLREQIDHIKAERGMFEHIYVKLERQLAEQKKQMAAVIEKSNQAYEARDEAHSKIMALREKADKEIQQYNMDMKDFMRQQEHERKLREFMGLKGTDRLKQTLSTTRKKNTVGDKEGQDEVIHSYEQLFKKLRELTNMQDTNKLVEKFVSVEDRCYALFNYVNELNNEIETIQEKIAESKITQTRMREAEEVGSKRDAAQVKVVNEKLVAAEQQITRSMERQGIIAAEIDALQTGIASLFEKIKCDQRPIVDVLGNSTISEDNIKTYLGLIELKANELLQGQVLVDAIARTKWEEQETEIFAERAGPDVAPPDANFILERLGPKPTLGGLLGAGPRELPEPTPVQAPAFVADNSEDEEDEEQEDEFRILSQEEMRQKINLDLTKKQQQQAKPLDRDSRGGGQSATISSGGNTGSLNSSFKKQLSIKR